MNKFTAMGRLINDPDLKTFTKNDKEFQVCKFTMALQRPGKVAEGEKPQSDFVKFTAFNGAAKTISEYCQKGTALLVEGPFRNDNYEKDGVKHYDYHIEVTNFEFMEPRKSGDAAKPAQKTTAAPAVASDDDELPF